MGYPQGGQPGSKLNSCALCVKYLLFVMNFLFFAIGCTVLGLGIWFLKEKNFMSTLVGNDLYTVGCWFVVIGGGIILSISFIGCIGAITENRGMILCYFVILLLIFMTLVVGGILALVFRSQIGEEVKSTMKESIQEYYGVNLDNSKNRAHTDAWDYAQEELYCCAVEDQSWATYRGSNWYKEQPGVEDYNKAMVPESCCLRNQYDEIFDKSKCQTHKTGPPERKSGETNEALYYRGCYSAGKEFLHEYTAYIAALGIGVGLLMFIGMFLAVSLFLQLRY